MSSDKYNTISQQSTTSGLLVPILPESIVKSIPKTIAWPTILLTLFAATSHLFVSYWYATSSIRRSSNAWYFIVGAVTCNAYFTFLLFTTMHDACHGSIGFGSYRWINDILGLISGSFFPVPYFGLKFCHLKHHKFTNDPDQDPDYYISLKKNNYFMLLVQCFTVELKYYSVYLPQLSSRPISEVFLALFQVICPAVLFYHLHSIGLGRQAMITWIIPGRLAIACLAYSFDYLPHYPHKVPRSEDEFKATQVTALYGSVTWPLTWPLLHQNYHNIHHLYPYIPFYLYSDVWKILKPDLQARGTVIKPIFPS